MHSMLLLLLVSLATPQAPAGSPVTRSVTIGVYTKKAEPVSDLKPEEVVVTEGGRKPAILGLEPDRRPLEVAIVIDSSAAMVSSYRSDLVAAVVGLWKGLPPETPVAVWTSGPPSKVVDFGTTLAAAEPLLQSVAPAGKNYAFDAMLDASRELARRPTERRVFVFVGGADIETTRARTAEATQALGQAAATPMLVLVLPGSAAAPIGGPTSGVSLSFDVQGYFERMAATYGGACWVVLSTQAAMKALQEARAGLVAPYRVRYESTAGETAAPKVEVRRKGVKVQVGRTQIEVLKRD
jgi:hypothetical protein